MARPLRYDPELADAIIRGIESGDSATVACRRAGVPRSSLYSWAKAGRGQLADRLSRAAARAKKLSARETAPDAAQPPTANPAGSTLISHDRFAAWLAANRDRLADRREQGKPAHAAAELPEIPQTPTTYVPNRAALRLLAAALEAIAAELRREGAS